ncbi:chorismate pyruvate-lyase family protein [Clostridium felsineum]|uniref:chorismate pyruvate-lyase family protein n=1 Tax=Clostridium felsineum TaxID=36839 RepID=UPI00098CC2DF|nr:chorismate pyruvate-lyase family protein [Clostridium felsineum]URZ14568.1 hypothetical protein CLFE_005650 [Clostridium felsineum DSM 794]
MINYNEINIENVIESGLVDIILKNDGSTTRLLETLVGNTITVGVDSQNVISKGKLPEEVNDYFKRDTQYLFRVVSLYYNGEVLSNNVVVAEVNKLNYELNSQLEKGQIPLGKLISKTDHIRNNVCSKIFSSNELQSLFQNFKLEKNMYPVKQYTIDKEGECWFYVCEVFHYDTILKYFKISNSNKKLQLT